MRVGVRGLMARRGWVKGEKPHTDFHPRTGKSGRGKGGVLWILRKGVECIVRAFGNAVDRVLTPVPPREKGRQRRFWVCGKAFMALFSDPSAL